MVVVAASCKGACFCMRCGRRRVMTCVVVRVLIVVLCCWRCPLLLFVALLAVRCDMLLGIRRAEMWLEGAVVRCRGDVFRFFGGGIFFGGILIATTAVGRCGMVW